MIQEFDPHDCREFSFDSVDFDGRTFVGEYTLATTKGSHKFEEVITLPSDGVQYISERAIRVSRLLALACGMSYFKAGAPRSISVAFGLTREERQFLSELISHGLGEFAYKNNLPHLLSPSIHAAPAEEFVSSRSAPHENVGSRPLVPVGGGKDSVVTIESLMRAGFNPILFSVNAHTPMRRCAEVSGCELINAERRIDKRLLRLNELGAYNGHVPVTAINSLIAMLTAESLGIGPVVMSNERSANEGNLEWAGSTINHQWSKSFAFEQLLHRALGEKEPGRYFSLLRPLTELEIARRFSGLTQYFTSFTSCNRAFTAKAVQQGSSWCTTCPKCQFVFLILAPFIGREALTAIFGKDLLRDRGNIQGYREILGLSGHKPFECVGEYQEAVIALVKIGSAPEWSGDSMVSPLVEEVAAQGKIPTDAEIAAALSAGPEHNIPTSFLEAAHALT